MNHNTEIPSEPLTGEVWQRFFRGKIPPEAMEGKVIDNRYRIIEIIGQGGMAVTFKALDLKHGALRAIKMPRRHQQSGFPEQELLQRFDAEYQALENLSNDYVVRYFDHGYDESGKKPTYLVMDYIDGATLAEHLQDIQEKRREPLTCAQAADIVEKLGEGLQYLHDKDRIHRDIKPANIMLREHDGTYTPVLIDLGILKKLKRDDAGLTGHGMLGSLKYMSPEQQRGEDLTPASDQYSLAVTFQDMIPANNGNRYISDLTKYQQAHIQRILEQAQNPAPKKRYRTIQELTIQVAKALRGDTTSAKFRYLVEETARAAQRQPILRFAIALGAGTLGVVLLGWLLSIKLNGGQDSAQAVAPPTAIVTSAPTLTYTAMSVSLPTVLATNTLVTPTLFVPSATMTATASHTPLPSPTATASATFSPTPSLTPSPTASPSQTLTSTASHTPLHVFDPQDVYARLKVQARSINRLNCVAYHALITEITDWARTSRDELATRVNTYISDSESGVMVIDRYCQAHPDEKLPADLRYEFSELQDFVELFKEG